MFAEVSTGQGIVAIGGLAGMVAVGIKLVDFAKLVTNLPEQTRAVITQLLSWLFGIALAFAYGASNIYGSSVKLTGTQTIRNADSASKILIGLAIGSSMSFAIDLKKAHDNNDSAAMPSIPIGPEPPSVASVQPVPTDGSPLVTISTPDGSFTGPLSQATAAGYQHTVTSPDSPLTIIPDEGDRGGYPIT